MKDLTNQDLEMIKDLLENREKYKIIEKTSTVGNFKSNLANIVIPFRDKYNIENDAYAIELSRCNKDILTCLRDLKTHSNSLTTKQRLEQFGWQESVVNKKNIYKEFDGIYIYISKDGIDINGTNEDTFIDTTELQLILDYIKEQEK